MNCFLDTNNYFRTLKLCASSVQVAAEEKSERPYCKKNPFATDEQRVPRNVDFRPRDMISSKQAVEYYNAYGDKLGMKLFLHKNSDIEQLCFLFCKLRSETLKLKKDNTI